MAVAKAATGDVAVDTRLREWGTSRAVRIPKSMCEAVGIDTGSNLEMRSGADQAGPFILIRPSQNHRSYGAAPFVSMDDAFDGYRGARAPSEFDWGKDVGAEAIP